jgi:hypothetical protein
MKFLTTAKLIMGNPNKFFNSVKKETDLTVSFVYLLQLLIIPTVMIIVLFSLFFTIMSGFLGPLVGVQTMGFLGPLIGIGAGISFYVISVIGSFIGAVILFIFIYIVGGRKGYTNTYKASVYGGTPGTLFAWIPFVNIVFGLWSLYLVIKGVSVLHEISMGRALLAILLPLIVAIVIIIGFVGMAFLTGMLGPMYY